MGEEDGDGVDDGRWKRGNEGKEFLRPGRPEENGKLAPPRLAPSGPVMETEGRQEGSTCGCTPGYPRINIGPASHSRGHLATAGGAAGLTRLCHGRNLPCSWTETNSIIECEWSETMIVIGDDPSDDHHGSKCSLRLEG